MNMLAEIDMDILASFISAVITIFAIVDPIGCLPIFVGLTQDVDAAQRRRVFRFAGVVAFVIICVMTVSGKYLLKDVFNIGFDEFRFGGGLLLIVVGVQDILSKPSQNRASPLEPSARQDVKNAIDADHIRLAVSPIAMPLLAGPGAIVTTMLIAERSGLLFALLACLVCFAFVIAILNWAHLVFRVLGNIGTLAVARVMDIFIVAIGVRFVFDGTFEYIIKRFPQLAG